MTATPNQRKPSKVEKPTTAAEFKKKRASDIVRLPSGNRVKIRRPGMIKFLEAGFLPDPLAELIKKEISQRTGKMMESDLFKSLAAGENMELLRETIRATDRIAAFCVVEPKVLWHERERKDSNSGEVVAYEDIPEEERDEDIVYTDEMEDEDKRFIFQLAVGGTADLAQFREATRSLVGDLSAGGEVVKTPQ